MFKLQTFRIFITSKFSAIKVTRIKSLEQYLDDMYLDYVAGNRNYFIEKDVNAILEDKSLSEKQLNLLAELFYRDALIQKEEKLKKILLQKSLVLFKHISLQSDTFSFEMVDKIANIENLALV